MYESESERDRERKRKHEDRVFLGRKENEKKTRKVLMCVRACDERDRGGQWRSVWRREEEHCSERANVAV